MANDNRKVNLDKTANGIKLLITGVKGIQKTSEETNRILSKLNNSKVSTSTNKNTSGNGGSGNSTETTNINTNITTKSETKVAVNTEGVKEATKDLEKLSDATKKAATETEHLIKVQEKLKSLKLDKGASQKTVISALSGLNDNISVASRAGVGLNNLAKLRKTLSGIKSEDKTENDVYEFLTKSFTTPNLKPIINGVKNDSFAKGFKEIEGSNVKKTRAIVQYVIAAEEALNEITKDVKVKAETAVKNAEQAKKNIINTTKKTDTTTKIINVTAFKKDTAKLDEIAKHVEECKKESDEALVHMLKTLKADNPAYQAASKVLAERGKTFQSFDTSALERNGKNITIDDFKKAFGITDVLIEDIYKDVKDRQKALNKAYDDFLKFSKTTGISPSSIGNNRLVYGITKSIHDNADNKGHSTFNKISVTNAGIDDDNTNFHELGHQFLNKIAERIFEYRLNSTDPEKKIDNIEDAVAKLFSDIDLRDAIKNGNVSKKDIEIVGQVRKIIEKTRKGGKEGGWLDTTVGKNLTAMGYTGAEWKQKRDYYTRNDEVFARLVSRFVGGYNENSEESLFEINNDKFNQFIYPLLKGLFKETSSTFNNLVDIQTKPSSTVTPSKSKTNAVVEKVTNDVKRSEQEKKVNKGMKIYKIDSSSKEASDEHVKSTIAEATSFAKNFEEVINSAVKTFEEKFKSAITTMADTFKNEFIKPFKQAIDSISGIVISLQKAGIVDNKQIQSGDVGKKLKDDIRTDIKDTSKEAYNQATGQKYGATRVLSNPIVFPRVQYDETQPDYGFITINSDFNKPDENGNLVALKNPLAGKMITMTANASAKYNYVKLLDALKKQNQVAIDTEMFRYVEEGTTQAGYEKELGGLLKQLEGISKRYNTLGDSNRYQQVKNQIEDFKNTFMRNGKINLSPIYSETLDNNGKVIGSSVSGWTADVLKPEIEKIKRDINTFNQEIETLTNNNNFTDQFNKVAKLRNAFDTYLGTNVSIGGVPSQRQSVANEAHMLGFADLNAQSILNKFDTIQNTRYQTSGEFDKAIDDVTNDVKRFENALKLFIAQLDRTNAEQTQASNTLNKQLKEEETSYKKEDSRIASIGDAANPFNMFLQTRSKYNDLTYEQLMNNAGFQARYARLQTQHNNLVGIAGTATDNAFNTALSAYQQEIKNLTLAIKDYTQQQINGQKQQLTDLRASKQFTAFDNTFNQFMRKTVSIDGMDVRYSDIIPTLGQSNLQHLTDFSSQRDLIEQNIRNNTYTGIDGIIAFNRDMNRLHELFNQLTSDMQIYVNNQKDLTNQTKATSEQNKINNTLQTQADKNSNSLEKLYNDFWTNLGKDVRIGNTRYGTREDVLRNLVNPDSFNQVWQTYFRLNNNNTNGVYVNNQQAFTRDIAAFADMIRQINIEINNTISQMRANNRALNQNNNTNNNTNNNANLRDNMQRTLDTAVNSLQTKMNDYNNWLNKEVTIGNQLRRQGDIAWNLSPDVSVTGRDFVDNLNGIITNLQQTDMTTMNRNQLATIIRDARNAFGTIINDVKAGVDNATTEIKNGIRIQNELIRQGEQLRRNGNAIGGRLNNDITRAIRNPTLNTLFMDYGDYFMRGNVRLNLTQQENRSLENHQFNIASMLNQLNNRRPDETDEAYNLRARNINSELQTERELYNALRENIANRIGRRVGQAYNEYTEIDSPRMQMFNQMTGFNLFRMPNERSVNWDVLSDENASNFSKIMEGLKFINLPTFRQGLNQLYTSLTRTLNGVVSMLQSAFNKIARLGSVTLKAFTIAIGGVTASVTGAIAAFTAFGKNIISTTDEFRKTTIALTGVYRTPAKAQEMVQMAYKASSGLPLSYANAMQTLNEISAIPSVQNLLRSPNSNVSSSMLDKMFRVITSMTTMRPDKTASDAVFSLRNAMAGDLRSLQRRFDLPVNSITNIRGGVGLGAVKNDPMALLDSLSSYFDSFLDVKVINQISRTIGIITEKIKGAIDLFKSQIGNSGFYDLVLKDFQKLQDKIVDFVSSDYGKQIAKRFSNAFSNMYESIKGIIAKISGTLLKAFDIKINTTNVVDMIAGLSEAFAKTLRYVESLIKDIDFESVIKNIINTISNFDIGTIVTKAKLYGSQVIDIIKNVANQIVDSIKWLKDTLKSMGLSDETISKGLIVTWLVGPGNAVNTISSVISTIPAMINTGLGAIGSAVAIKSAIDMSKGIGASTAVGGAVGGVALIGVKIAAILAAVVGIALIFKNYQKSWEGFLKLFPKTLIGIGNFLVKTISSIAKRFLDIANHIPGLNTTFDYNANIEAVNKGRDSALKFLKDTRAKWVTSIKNWANPDGYEWTWNLFGDKKSKLDTEPQDAVFQQKSLMDSLVESIKKANNGLEKTGNCAKYVNKAFNELGIDFLKGHAEEVAYRAEHNPNLRKLDINSYDELRQAYQSGGLLATYGKTKSHPHGHVEITIGGGKGMSDHTSNIEHIIEQLKKGAYSDYKVYAPVSTGKFTVGDAWDAMMEYAEKAKNEIGKANYTNHEPEKVETDYIAKIRTESKKLDDEIRGQRSKVTEAYGFDTVSKIFGYGEDVNSDTIKFGSIAIERMKTNITNVIGNVQRLFAEFEQKTKSGEIHQDKELLKAAIDNVEKTIVSYEKQLAETIEKSAEMLEDAVANMDFQYIGKDVQKFVSAQSRTFDNKLLQEVMNNIRQQYSGYFAVKGDNEGANGLINNAVQNRNGDLKRLLNDYSINGLRPDILQNYSVNMMNSVIPSAQYQGTQLMNVPIAGIMGAQTMYANLQSDILIVDKIMQKFKEFYEALQPVVDEQNRIKVMVANVNNMRLGELNSNWNLYMTDKNKAVRSAAGERYMAILNEGIETDTLEKMATRIVEITTDSFSDIRTLIANGVKQLVTDTQTTMKNGIVKLATEGGTVKPIFKEMFESAKKTVIGVYAEKVANDFTGNLFKLITGSDLKAPKTPEEQYRSNVETGLDSIDNTNVQILETLKTKLENIDTNIQRIADKSPVTNSNLDNIVKDGGYDNLSISSGTQKIINEINNDNDLIKGTVQLQEKQGGVLEPFEENNELIYDINEAKKSYEQLMKEASMPFKKSNESDVFFTEPYIWGKVGDMSIPSERANFIGKNSIKYGKKHMADIVNRNLQDAIVLYNENTGSNQAYINNGENTVLPNLNEIKQEQPIIAYPDFKPEIMEFRQPKSAYIDTLPGTMQDWENVKKMFAFANMLFSGNIVTENNTIKPDYETSYIMPEDMKEVWRATPEELYQMNEQLGLNDNIWEDYKKDLFKDIKELFADTSLFDENGNSNSLLHFPTFSTNLDNLMKQLPVGSDLINSLIQMSDYRNDEKYWAIINNLVKNDTGMESLEPVLSEIIKQIPQYVMPEDMKEVWRATPEELRQMNIQLGLITDNTSENNSPFKYIDESKLKPYSVPQSKDEYMQQHMTEVWRANQNELDEMNKSIYKSFFDTMEPVTSGLTKIETISPKVDDTNDTLKHIDNTITNIATGSSISRSGYTDSLISRSGYTDSNTATKEFLDNLEPTLSPEIENNVGDMNFELKLDNEKETNRFSGNKIDGLNLDLSDSIKNQVAKKSKFVFRTNDSGNAFNRYFGGFMSTGNNAGKWFNNMLFGVGTKNDKGIMSGNDNGFMGIIGEAMSGAGSSIGGLGGILNITSGLASGKGILSSIGSFLGSSANLTSPAGIVGTVLGGGAKLLMGGKIGGAVASKVTGALSSGLGSAILPIAAVAYGISKLTKTKDKTAEGRARGAEFNTLRDSLIANRNTLARNYYMANDDTLNALRNYRFGEVAMWTSKRGSRWKGTRRRVMNTDATAFVNSMQGYWDLLQRADEENRATQRSLNKLQNTNNMEYLVRTGTYEEKRRNSIQEELSKYRNAVKRYAGHDTSFTQTLFDGQSYTLTQLNDKVNDLIKELGDSKDAIAQNTEAIRQEKLATESAKLDYQTALYGDLDPTIASKNNLQKLQNEWNSIVTETPIIQEYERITGKTWDGSKSIETIKEVIGTVQSVGYTPETKEYWDYMTRLTQANRELKNAQKQQSIDLSTNWISDLRGIAMENGTYDNTQIKQLSKLYGKRENLKVQIQNAVDNMDSALAEKLYDESQAITEEIEHYKSSTSFSNAINNAKENLNNIFGNVKENPITSLIDNTNSIVNVIKQSEQWIKDAGYSGYDELDSNVLLPLLNSSFSNVNEMANVFTEGLNSGVFDTTEINPFKDYYNNWISTVESMKTVYRDAVDSGASEAELRILMAEYQTTLEYNMGGMNDEYKKMFKKYQQNNAATSILGSISGFEDYTVANDAFKEFTETLGSDAMEKLMGYSGNSFDSESLGKFMNVSGLNGDSDPYEMYYEWEKKRILQRIENYEEGSEEWQTAELELWNLMADNAKYLKEKAEKTTATIEEMLNKIEETARTRVAEEAKSAKGDIIFVDLGSSRDGTQFINNMLDGINANTPETQKLVKTLKQKLMGVRR